MKNQKGKTSPSRSANFQLLESTVTAYCTPARRGTLAKVSKSCGPSKSKRKNDQNNMENNLLLICFTVEMITRHKYKEALLTTVLLLCQLTVGSTAASIDQDS